jgi:hypothetical protein
MTTASPRQNRPLLALSWCRPSRALRGLGFWCGPSRAPRGLAVLFAALAGAAAGSCDPVHDNARAALGGEVPGVPPGPMHRPGQPCLLCHDGATGDPAAFSMAGTVFLDANTLTPAPGATVTLVGADGTTTSATTNGAGNFFLTPGAYAPRYPVHVTSVTLGGVSVTMHSHIGGDGSCAGCHFDPAGPDSPGHVYFQIVGKSP